MKIINNIINTMAIMMLLLSLVLMLQNTAWLVAIILAVMGFVFLVSNIDFTSKRKQ